MINIDQEIKQAMLAKDQVRLRGLRAIKAALLLAKTEKLGAELSEDTELKLLQKLVKQRRESAEIYNAQNREDMANAELFQAGIIEQYLPQQLSPEEIKTVLQKIISDTGANSAKDMGKVMGLASKELAGKADGKTISALVKELLS